MGPCIELRRVALWLLLLAAATGTSAAGPAWLPPTTALAPHDRAGHALAYDAAHGTVVLFGGFGSGYLGDTWVWNGTKWQLASTR
jgi:hypothetical protein